MGRHFEGNLHRHGVPAAILALGAVLLAGCASMNEDECRTADWTQVGYLDGIDGRPEQRFADHQKACAKHGITADLQAYRQGRIRGVRSYCVPETGFREGLEGARYEGVCPPDLAADFQAAYEDGRRIYDLREEVEAISRRMTRLADRAEDIEDRARDIDVALAGDGLTAEERRALVEEMRDLRAEIGDLEGERGELRADLDRARRRLIREEALILPAYGYSAGIPSGRYGQDPYGTEPYR